jgi:hypothetical protein
MSELNVNCNEVLCSWDSLSYQERSTLGWALVLLMYFNIDFGNTYYVLMEFDI